MMKSAQFNREGVGAQLHALAAQGVYLGTSSWKYPGWLGQVYDESRYRHRGRFSQRRFERQCLSEYAEVFPTVGVDATYYRFPSAQQIEELMATVGPDFRFSFKLPGEITLKHFPKLPRFGALAGQSNPHFLDTDRLVGRFLEPCAPFRDRLGLLMFEFTRFTREDFARGRDFATALDRFLGELPRGWPFGVELRNRTFLHPDYFAVLARHGVSHVFNNWTAMPPVVEQLDLAGAYPQPARVGARFLLRTGRRYQEAVDRFAPYDRIQEVQPEGRAAGARLIRDTLATNGTRQTFIYVNNRFEGNAPETIAAMLEQAGCPGTGSGPPSAAS